jgi:hypothetical protein
MMPKNFIYFVDYDRTGCKIIWKEYANNFSQDKQSLLKDLNDLDIIEKAEEVGIEIPVGKNCAMKKDILIEKIITNLTYSI